MVSESEAVKYKSTHKTVFVSWLVPVIIAIFIDSRTGCDKVGLDANCARIGT